ncbi:DedA family protein [Novosphingobium gossypii]|uniref:DedA family protein n=1 Tax=Novosphingobium gossypii TaxID=1604774 RepID=UPI003D1F425D
MTIEAIILRYGVAAIFVGAAVEGETVVVLGGILAHRGLIDPIAAAAAAVAGSFLADQTLFLAGRRFRGTERMQRIIGRPTFARAMARLERHPVIFILSFRFLYGLRTVSPVAVGVSQVPASRFLLLNGIAACIWGPLFTSLGYAFGDGVEAVFGRVRSMAHLLLAGLAAAAVMYLVILIVRWWRSRPDAGSGR